MMFPNNRKNDEASWFNFFINIGILALTVELLQVSYKNLAINKKTLEINTRNTNNSGKTAELLEEINKKVMIDTIIYHYYKGKCLYFLERYFEAKEMFSYVVENGNTLYFVELSKVYLTDIKLL